MKAQKTQDFLLEIGCEEIPADYLPGVLDWNYPQGCGLASAASLVFDQHKIVWKEIQSFGTPRRLLLKVSGMGSVVREEVEGPPASIAFDPKGNPTQAAEGFAKKQGVPVSKLKRKQTPRGERLVLERSIAVTEVLKEAIPQIVEKIAFPKTMRWDDSGVRFARPIRSMAARYGSKVISCRFGNLVASSAVVAGPVSVAKRLKVQFEAGQCLRKKEDGSVEPLAFCRSKSQALLQKLEAAARRLGGCLPDQTTEHFQWLFSTMTFLAEDPFVASGTFDKEYLDLPVEALTTSMAKHLKLMSVHSKDGTKLLPQFLVVLEGRPSAVKKVTANMERILEARFSDARLFYREDVRAALSQKVSELQKVVFHEKLGSVHDRIPRMERLMVAIAKELKLEALLPLIPKTARLAKADLVTHMVREFPSLQGAMGGYYAKHDGEPFAVADALAQQYRPCASRDPLPQTPLAALLGMADRLDLLIGFFSAGMKPTGSVDPYGLRRQAMGLVRILIEPPSGISFAGLSIDRVLDAGIQSWDFRLAVEPSLLKKQICQFLKERLEWLAFVEKKIDRGPIDAVLSVCEDDIAEAWQRLGVLWGLWRGGKRSQVLLDAAKIAERTSRMVGSAKGFTPVAVDETFMKESLEKELWHLWQNTRPGLQEQLRRHRYEDALRTYAGLYPAVHAFFEKVFVMDENSDVRRNRLSMMKEIHEDLAAHFADLSKLPLSGVE